MEKTTLTNDGHSSALRPIYNKSDTLEPTQFLRIRWRKRKDNLEYVGKVAEEEISKICAQFGTVRHVFARASKPECFVTMDTIEQAMTAKIALHDVRISPFCTSDQGSLHCAFVNATFAASVGAARTPLQDVDETQAVIVPGLLFVKDFISEEEEQQLLEELNQNSWDESISRRVQHYGLKFDYIRRAIDFEADVPPLTPTMQCLIKRIQAKGISEHIFDQVTVNEYPPGTGISPHVDTAQVFDECIASLTLNAPSVMEFRPISSSEVIPEAISVKDNRTNNQTLSEEEKFAARREAAVRATTKTAPIGVPLQPGTKGSVLSGPADNTLANRLSKSGTDMSSNTQDSNNRKLIDTTRRSLIAMKHDARYSWLHGIAARKTDLVHGQIRKRATRISITFRRVLQSKAEAKAAAKAADFSPPILFSPALQQQQKQQTQQHEEGIEDSVVATETNTNNQVSDSGSILQTPAVEAEHVHRLYDSIAAHFSHTRHSGWPRVVDFVSKLPTGTIVADVGCGNGKYLGVNPNVACIGSDRSIGLVSICGERGYEAFAGDGLAIPMRTACADVALSIAVLHHISTLPRRQRCIEELARITKIGGQILIQAWAFEQEANSRRQFQGQDVMVPWHLDKRFVSASADEIHTSHAQFDSQGKRVIFQRYCHVYREGELEELVTFNHKFVIEECWWDKGNWCIIATRCQSPEDASKLNGLNDQSICDDENKRATLDSIKNTSNAFDVQLNFA